MSIAKEAIFRKIVPSQRRIQLPKAFKEGDLVEITIKKLDLPPLPNDK